MPNLLELFSGAETVLPITVQRFREGEVSVQSVRIARFIGTKMIVASGPVSSSKTGSYLCQIAFYGVDPNAPQVSDRCGVRCSCEGYRFYFDSANRKAGASHGARFTPYVRKTAPNDTRYPPRNPQQVAGCCKHLLSLMQTLTNSDFFNAKPPEET